MLTPTSANWESQLLKMSKGASRIVEETLALVPGLGRRGWRTLSTKMDAIFRDVEKKCRDGSSGKHSYFGCRRRCRRWRAIRRRWNTKNILDHGVSQWIEPLKSWSYSDVKAIKWFAFADTAWPRGYLQNSNDRLSPIGWTLVFSHSLRVTITALA